MNVNTESGTEVVERKLGDRIRIDLIFIKSSQKIKLN